MSLDCLRYKGNEKERESKSAIKIHKILMIDDSLTTTKKKEFL